MILKIEKNILLWLDQKKEPLALIILILCGAITRFFLRNVYPGGIAMGFSIFGMAIPVALCKMIAGTFDYLMAFLAAAVTYISVEEKNQKRQKSLIVFAVVLFSPLTLLDSSSAAWGSSIYTTFLLLALWLALRERYFLSFLTIGVACLFHMDALLLLPFFVFLYVYKKKFSALYFLVILLAAFVSYRWIAAGGNTALYLYRQYPGFWAFEDEGANGALEAYTATAWILLVIVVMMALWILARKCKALSAYQLLCCAFLLTYLTAYFVPQSTYRSSYFYEILAIMIVVYIRQTLLPAVALQVITLYLYTSLFYRADLLPISVSGLAWMNGILLVVYMIIISSSLKTRK